MKNTLIRKLKKQSADKKQSITQMTSSTVEYGPNTKISKQTKIYYELI